MSKHKLVKTTTTVDTWTDNAKVSANTVNVSTPIIFIRVPPTETYIVQRDALIQLWLEVTAGVDLTAVSEVNFYACPPGDDVDSLPKTFLGKFNMNEFDNSDLYNKDEQVHLNMDKSIRLKELDQIIVFCKASTLIDWTLAGSMYGLEVERLKRG